MKNEAISPVFPRLQSRRFLVLYGLATAGGSASYAPFLTLILPMHVAGTWGSNAVEILSAIAFVGAVSASIANILFGWASDLIASRPVWIVGGLFLSSVLLVSMQFVETLPALLVLIALWQTALNMMLSPLSAWAGDCVPDEQKGILGGILSFSPAGGALVGALVTIPNLASADTRLFVVAILVMVMVLPVVFFGNPVPMPHLMAKSVPPIFPNASEPSLQMPAIPRVTFQMWFARLLMQIAETALFAFLLLWFGSFNTGIDESDTARLFTIVLFSSVPIAIAIGRWSDRKRRPMLPLAILAGVAAAGLGLMACADEAMTAIAGYMLFGTMSGAFLALQASQMLRVLPRQQTRGRDLGFFNLTNTLPSLIMPWLALALVPLFGFRTLFLVLAGFALLSSLLLVKVQALLKNHALQRVPSIQIE